MSSRMSDFDEYSGYEVKMKSIGSTINYSKILAETTT